MRGHLGVLDLVLEVKREERRGEEEGERGERGGREMGEREGRQGEWG